MIGSIQLVLKLDMLAEKKVDGLEHFSYPPCHRQYNISRKPVQNICHSIYGGYIIFNKKKTVNNFLTCRQHGIVCLCKH